MPSFAPSSRALSLFAVLLIAGGAASFAWRWQYVSTPGSPIVRVNRWTSRTEFLTDSGWTAISHDPFRGIGDRRP